MARRVGEAPVGVVPAGAMSPSERGEHFDHRFNINRAHDHLKHERGPRIARALSRAVACTICLDQDGALNYK